MITIICGYCGRVIKRTNVIYPGNSASILSAIKKCPYCGKQFTRIRLEINVKGKTA